MNKYLIGDFLKRIKRSIDLNRNQDYKLVTIKMNHKGVVLRELKKGSEIKSKMNLVKEGDFILSGIDARNGAFGIIPKELDNAIVTNDFWYFEIDEDIILKELFLELTSTTWFDEICKRGSDGTTQRIRLQKDKFFNQEVLLPKTNEQKDLLKKIKGFKEKRHSLNTEISNSFKYINELKQSILQDAIQGKLTTEWRKQNPDVEPATELLKRIQAEKAQLIKEKKIKKEKPLPPINENEIPFELPKDWTWCRIGDIAQLFTGDSINKELKESKYTNKEFEGLPYIGTKDVDFGMNGVNYDVNVKIPIDEINSIFKVAPKGTVLTCIEGGSSGKKIGLTNQDVCFGNKLLATVPYLKCLSRYFYYLFNSPFFKEEFVNQSKGLRGGVSVNSFKLIKFPMPSLEEQHIIVEKIEQLLEKCNALQNEVETMQQQSDLLLKALFNEIFEVSNN